jgi:hypothetical protein
MAIALLRVKSDLVIMVPASGVVPRNLDLATGLREATVPGREFRK